MKFDLHMHSNASSDGQFTPAELVEIAAGKQLDVIALTDHDSIANVSEIIREAASRDITVIPGIEISTSLGEQDVHLLGYGIDLNDPWIRSLADASRSRSKDVFSRRVTKMNEHYGFSLDEEAILKKADGKNPWFTLIDEVLEDEKTKTIDDFQDYLPGGSRSVPAAVNFFWDRCQPGSPLYVRVGNPDLKECIRKVHEAGGLAVLAHPFRAFDHQGALLEELIDAGLDGIEVYSNYHTPEQIDWYLQFAQDHGLLISCGSDFHGEKKPNIEMGEYHLETDGTPWLQSLQAALSKAGN